MNYKEWPPKQIAFSWFRTPTSVRYSRGFINQLVPGSTLQLLLRLEIDGGPEGCPKLSKIFKVIFQGCFKMGTYCIEIVRFRYRSPSYIT